MADQPKQDPTRRNETILSGLYPEPQAIFSFTLRSLEQSLTDGLIVLDTNTLLVPYGASKAGTGEIEKLYKKFVTDGRLIVPAQVAREFAARRADRLKELYQQISQKRNIGLTGTDYPPLLAALPEYKRIRELEDDLDLRLKIYREAVTLGLERIRSWTWNDPVSELYKSLFNEGVVHEAVVDDIKVSDELERRNSAQIPPGYKDAAKTKNAEGDLFIWLSILSIGGLRRKDVIFVTGEEKSDWWYKSDSTALYPRYELVDEFRRASGGQSFHIVSLAGLLKTSGVAEDVVTQIQNQELEVVREQVEKSQAAHTRGITAHRVFGKWLRSVYSHVTAAAGKPDYIAITAHGATGFDVRIVRHERQVDRYLRKIISGDIRPIAPIQSLFLVLIGTDDVSLHDYFRIMVRANAANDPKLSVGILPGYVRDDTFVPFSSALLPPPPM